ncbi:hypothetical protein CH063_06546 [Colletotrichum higginsianum]|uniref:Secreted protein n=2 Tax=Colletotrichum higginsianum TaxID=80884 RepID=H1V2X7_COLHI|nr:Secreted protein [Colletotrichum higginsianum IMI 349063]OBR13494.1 Secreted protein [Colletotrichum higginsianum IMI 349063]TID02842.1 hypothetical protein CH35J_003715 [Colletotrichum higginsianum]CCF34579.1 hypothetical protein CH063_06546 [Colletotrichum higginsianum]
MRFTLILALLPALSVVLADDDMDSPMGSKEFVPTWEFEPFPGEKVVLNGTIEQVVAELKEINPDYSPFSSDSLAQADASFLSSTVQLPEIYPRDKVLCNMPKWGFVDTYSSDRGYSHLLGVRGRPRGDPGPGNCGRVSCGYKAAVWFCNDNKRHIVLDNFQEIAHMVGFIKYYCSANSPSKFNGQAFHQTGNWNVVLRRASC